MKLIDVAILSILSGLGLMCSRPIPVPVRDPQNPYNLPSERQIMADLQAALRRASR